MSIYPLTYEESGLGPPNHAPAKQLPPNLKTQMVTAAVLIAVLYMEISVTLCPIIDFSPKDQRLSMAVDAADPRHCSG